MQHRDASAGELSPPTDLPVHPPAVMVMEQERTDRQEMQR